jgi:hypothetical protein
MSPQVTSAQHFYNHFVARGGEEVGHVELLFLRHLHQQNEDYPPGDHVARRLTYLAYAARFAAGEYGVDGAGDPFVLAALRVQAEFGDHDPRVHRGRFFADQDLRRLLPGMLVDAHDGDHVALHEKIFAEHRKVHGLSSGDAEEAYLARLRVAQYHGAVQVPAKDIVRGVMRVLAFTAERLLVLSLPRREVVAAYYYGDLVAWAVDGPCIAFSTRDGTDEIFAPTSVGEVALLMGIHIRNLVGKITTSLGKTNNNNENENDHHQLLPPPPPPPSSSSSSSLPLPPPPPPPQSTTTIISPSHSQEIPPQLPVAVSTTAAQTNHLVPAELDAGEMVEKLQRQTREAFPPSSLHSPRQLEAALKEALRPRVDPAPGGFAHQTSLSSSLSASYPRPLASLSVSAALSNSTSSSPMRLAGPPSRRAPQRPQPEAPAVGLGAADTILAAARALSTRRHALLAAAAERRRDHTARLSVAKRAYEAAPSKLLLRRIEQEVADHEAYEAALSAQMSVLADAERDAMRLHTLRAAAENDVREQDRQADMARWADYAEKERREASQKKSSHWSVTASASSDDSHPPVGPDYIRTTASPASAKRGAKPTLTPKPEPAPAPAPAPASRPPNDLAPLAALQAYGDSSDASSSEDAAVPIYFTSPTSRHSVRHTTLQAPRQAGDTVVVNQIDQVVGAEQQLEQLTRSLFSFPEEYYVTGNAAEIPFPKRSSHRLLDTIDSPQHRHYREDWRGKNK